MNKLDKYLNKLSSKDLLYLFLSIPILFFLIYYQFIYTNMLEKTKKLKRKESFTHRKYIKVSNELRKLRNINTSFKSYQIKVNSLRENYKFIKYNVDSVKLLKLTDIKVYEILTNILNFSKKEGLDISISIDKKNAVEPFNKSMSVLIKGNGRYINIIRFLSYIEAQPILHKIKYIEISKETNNNSKIIEEKFIISFDIVGVE